MAEENIKMIEAQNDMMWFEGSPMAVCAVRLALDVPTGEVFTTAKWMSLKAGVVQSIVFDVICYDAVRKPLNRMTNMRFDHIDARRNTSFGYELRVEVPDINTRNVEYVLRQVIYADGTQWVNAGDQRFDTRLEQENIYTVQGGYNKQFREICTRSGIDGMNLVLQPVFEPDHWLCACGAFNWADEENCSQCKVNKAWLQKSTDLSLLQQMKEREDESVKTVQEQVASYDTQQERDAQKAEFAERAQRFQQEEKKQKRRQMTRKTMRLLIAGLLILALGAYFLMTFVFPKLGEAEEYETSASQTNQV